jgi:heat shock protein HslJ
MAHTLEGTSWVLAATALDAAGVDEFTPTAEFNDGTVSGTTGVNRYTGTYTKSRSKLSPGPVASTRRAGSPAAMAIEREYLSRLDRVTSFKISGDTLTLADAKGAPVLVYEVSKVTLEGSWEIIGYLMTSGTGFSSTVIDSAPSAVFGADGSLSGATGCNSYRGTYTVDGVAVTIGPLRTTRMACPPELAEQETGILKALESATTIELKPGGATLLNESGQRAISLAAG